MPKITKSQQQTFIRQLAHAEKESDVRIVYRNVFEKYYGNQVRIITEYHNTDILVETVGQLFYSLKLLAEIKYSENFTDEKTARAKVGVQILYYLHKFNAAGEILPNILLAADKNELFVIYGPKLYDYLDRDYDWSLTPSLAWQNNFDLFNELLSDPNLDVIVYNLNSINFDFNYIFTLIDELLKLEGKFNAIEVNRTSLLKIFEDFNKNAFGGMAVDSKIKMQILFNKFLNNNNVYLHPKKKDMLCVQTSTSKIKEYPVNAGQFEAFFSQYNIKDFHAYQQLTEIADTIIEEIDRRFTGDFWTPKLWVDRAHALICEQLGDDWKERFVVWDAACGTKNLTRDYKFANLYCSTLHQEEMEISDMYNPEATTFQYDFLNDDIWLHTGQRAFDDNLKMPIELLNALKENRPIVFFMNPPYGQATGIDKRLGNNKSDISKTKINELMINENLGHACLELYTQFIYRVQRWAKTFNYTKDCHFFFFNKGFLTSPNFGEFTEQLCRQFSFEKGFMFNAGEFHGTSAAWGIIFSHWKLNPNDNPQTEFKFDVLENNAENIIAEKCKWVGKFTKNKGIDNWGRLYNKNNQITDFPITAGGFDVSAGNKPRVKKMTKNYLGYYQGARSNVQQSNKFTVLFSMANYQANGTEILTANFEKICITMAVKKGMREKIEEQDLLWVRDKDIFHRPSETLLSSEIGQEFTADCVVYSLFASGSNQTALREYAYNGKKYRVNNEFFWLPKQHINELAVKQKNFEIQMDLDGDNERFVYQWLQNHTLSAEAKSLLDYTTNLLDESFPLRQTYANLYPKYNLNAWDAGWLQIYKMLFSNDRINDTFKDKQIEFKSRLRTLGNKICKVAEEDGMI